MLISTPSGAVSRAATNLLVAGSAPAKHRHFPTGSGSLQILSTGPLGKIVLVETIWRRFGEPAGVWVTMAKSDHHTQTEIQHSTKYLSCQELADLLRTSRAAVYQLLYRGALPQAAIRRRGRRVLFVRQVIEREYLKGGAQ